MKTVFADTYYFLALANPHDAGHRGAVDFTKGFSGTFTTTWWVLTEVADAEAINPAGRNHFMQTLKALQGDDHVEIAPLALDLLQKGLTLYQNRQDKTWSLTDCISFCWMKQQGIREALTADRDFEQAGFIALLRVVNK